MCDPVLGKALAVIDQPVIRARPGGYSSLFRIIIEQQVSVPSAQAILARCEAAIPDICAKAVVQLSENDLRAMGLSGPKVRYIHAAAKAELAGTLDTGRLSDLSNEQAAAHLTAITGIGPWTAAIYLLFCEGRLDIWPRGDVALRAAWMAASDATTKPVMAAFDTMAEDWAPWRGVAAHILWTYYAHIRGRMPV